MTRTVDDAVGAVVDAGNCSGCGLCAALDPGLRMRLSPAGYMRPVRETGSASTDPEVLAAFDRACPGRHVRAQAPEGSRPHDTMGPVRSIVAAWAADPDLRHRGGSGGALSALTAWLLAEGGATAAVGARQGEEGARTETARIDDASEVPALAGSRYAPVSNASAAGVLGSADVFVGKPCEVSAMRALAEGDPSRPQPLLLSFFCAGTPSQSATERLVHDLGMPEGEEVAELWYRGRGWPGRFTAVGEAGTTVSTTYEESWGAVLGKALQWRCRTCPDGVGESADLVAADLWDVDNAGEVDFTDSDAGVSAVIARTARGEQLLERAVAAGVLGVQPADVDALAAVQPLQRRRRAGIAARLAAQRLSGAPTPRYSGFGLLRRARPREFVRTLRRAREQYRLTAGRR